MYKFFVQQLVDKFQHSLVGYELLMRKRDGDQWVLPVDFATIPVKDVVNALLEAAELLKGKVPIIALNLNRDQLLNTDLLNGIVDCKDKIVPLKLVVEITEEESSQKIDDELILDRVKFFWNNDIQIALDDVSNGENHFDGIVNLIPFASEIKFALQNDHLDFSAPEVQRLISNWQDIANQHHIRFVLEGIETSTDDVTADRLGIAYRQGYYYGKPYLVDS